MINIRFSPNYLCSLNWHEYFVRWAFWHHVVCIWPFNVTDFCVRALSMCQLVHKYRIAVLPKPVLEDTLPCTFCMSPLSDTPNSCLAVSTNELMSWIRTGLGSTAGLSYALLRWLRELNALQLQKTHANRKSTSKSRKHLQFDSRCSKCSQHKQMKNFICSTFLFLVVYLCVVKLTKLLS